VTRCRIQIVLGLALLLLAAPATAQKKDPPPSWRPPPDKTEPAKPPATDPPKTDETPPPRAGKPPGGMMLTPKQRATALAKTGAQLAQDGHYADAASKFQQSILVFPMTDVYYNLAYCYEQVGNWKGCVDSYTNYLAAYRKEHDGADPAEIISINRSIEKCRETAQPPISIESTPAGAQVSIGEKGKLLGVTPLTKKLEPGTYKIFITKEGFKPVETFIVVQPKQEGRFLFDLQQVVNNGTVRIKVNIREATIYIDGKNYGLSPYLETPELPIGSHQLVLKKDRYTTINASFSVKQGEMTELTYSMVSRDPEPSWRSYIGWASVSIGLVAIAGGVVAFRFAEDEFNDTTDFSDLQLVQNVGYGAGGSLIGIGTILLIWEAYTDSVDTRDLIVDRGPRFDFTVMPTRGGAFIGTGMRF